MKRNHLKQFVSIVLLVVIGPIQAQNVINRLEMTNLLKSDTITNTNDTVVHLHVHKYEQEIHDSNKPRGIIGRNAMKNVFVPKGQWMVGGQVAWNQWNNDNLNYLVIKDINFEAYTFSAGPYFGYFFTNNIAVGGRFSYNRYFINLGELDLNLGDDFNIGLKDLYYLQHNYETCAFLRSYLPIGNSKIFGFFGELQLNYTFSEGINSTGKDITFSAVYERAHNLEIGLGGGMAVFLTNNVAAEIMVNVGGYHVKWGRQNTNNIEEGKISNSGANFRVNLFSIKFGATYYL